MNTAAKTAPTEKSEVAVFQPPRLPYHPAIKDRFGVDPSGWKALVEAVFPNAKSIDSVVLALSYCKGRNLDPFKRPVHIVPMWDSKLQANVETIWPGISELRTTAFRTGNYAGADETEFGPMIEHNFTGRVQVWEKGQKTWAEKEVTVKAPEWCRMTVYRDLHGRLCKFVGPKVYWRESYATIGASEIPNTMWQERPMGQIEKCAEAAALRKAFPEELGNEYSAEEMAGRRVITDDRETAERVSRQAIEHKGPPPPDTVKGGEKKAQPQSDVIDGEIVEDGEIEEEAKPPAGLTKDEEVWVNELSGAFSSCEAGETEKFGKFQQEMMAEKKKVVSAAAWAKARVVAEENYTRIAG